MIKLTQLLEEAFNLNEHLDGYEFEDFYTEEENNIFSEFKHRKKYNYVRQPWPVVKFDDLKRVWEEYMKLGFVRNEKLLNTIAERIVRCYVRLEINTMLLEHTSYDPDETFEQYGIISEKEKDRFYDWIDDEHGSYRLSDYGLEPIGKQVKIILDTDKPEDRLQAIDRILNVIHMRSDMAANFVEGGSQNLSRLSGLIKDSTELNETNKSTLAVRRYYKRHPGKVRANLKKTQDDRIRRNRDRRRAERKHGKNFMKNRDVHHPNGVNGGKTKIVKSKNHGPDKKK